MGWSMAGFLWSWAWVIVGWAAQSWASLSVSRCGLAKLCAGVGGLGLDWAKLSWAGRVVGWAWASHSLAWHGLPSAWADLGVN
jgi:hypothetical protein